MLEDLTHATPIQVHPQTVLGAYVTINLLRALAPQRML